MTKKKAPSISRANLELDRVEKTLRAHDFRHSIAFATPDSFMLIDGALMKRFGPYYLIWTEHHGNFLEHEDEVMFFRYTSHERPATRLRSSR